MKTQDRVGKAMMVLWLGFAFWILASWWQIYGNNTERGYEYSKYNAFVILEEVSEWLH